MDDFIYDDGSMVPFTKYTYVLHYSRGHFKMKLSKMQYIRCREGGRILRLGGPKKFSGAGQTKILIFRGI